MERKLASIRVVREIQPIEGADLIELAIIDGWQAVVKKGELKPGEKCIYIEIDSLLPPVEPFKFMEPRKYRVRTMKLRGCLSQGLALPLSAFSTNFGTAVPGTDVTKLLNITKYGEEDIGEPKRKRGPLMRFLMGFAWVRWVHGKLKPKTKGAWPEYFPHTDEERVQNIRNLESFIGDHILYASEKLDGQSFSAFFVGNKRVGLFKQGLYGVCSRNVWFKHPSTTNNNWCNIARARCIEDILRRHYRETAQSIAIQGELVGPSIQGNRYDLRQYRLYVYNVFNITTQSYLSLIDKRVFCEVNGLMMVPIFGETPPSCRSIQDFLLLAEGKSEINGCEREGIVVRSITDDKLSFKAISNKFLMGEK
jgi:hypothetical protein